VQCNLLVVDDEETILAACEEYFSFLGYSVSTAKTVGEATRLLGENRYQALIADLRLGDPAGGDGLQVVREARKVCSKMQIAIMSAYGSQEVFEEAHQHGVAQFFHKPVALRQLADFLQSAVPLAAAS
jgi:DNA-binding NtrC family response regulator